jgi:hypothetical protein
LNVCGYYKFLQAIYENRVRQYIKAYVVYWKLIDFYLLLLFIFAEESLEDGYFLPAATVMEEKSEHVRQTEPLPVTRDSQERPTPSILLSEKLNSIGRSLDEFRVRTPSEEQSDGYEEEGEDEDSKERNVKQMTAKMKLRNIAAVTKPVDSDLDFCDTNSGLWRMLSAYDDLVLSQPGYNTFRQEGKHWLETDTVPWIVMEESREKCLEWLEKQNKHKSSA